MLDQRDQFNLSMMDYILRIVKYVHENHSKKETQSNRLIILTLYVTLIEQKNISERELGEIISNVWSWMNMEEEAYN